MRRRLPRWSEFQPLLRPERIPLNPTERRLGRAHTIADLREIAARRVPRAVFDYTDGAAEREISLRRARNAFARVEFHPQALRDVSDPDPAVTVLGRRWALPFALAPTGFTRMMHHEGERAAARAAQRAGVTYALSTMGTTSIEEVAAAAPDARKWFQLYVWRDRAAGKDLLERAHAAGYEALLLTVDTPVGGARMRDVRNGLTVPARAHPRHRARRGDPPGLVVQPAHHRAAHLRQPERVARHGRRPGQRDVRPDRDVRRHRVAARGLAGPAADQGHPHRGGRPRRGGSRRGRDRRVHPRRPPAGPGRRPAGGAAADRGRGRRPGRGPAGHRDPERRGHRRRAGPRRQSLPGRAGLPVRADGRRGARGGPGDRHPRRGDHPHPPAARRAQRRGS